MVYNKDMDISKLHFDGSCWPNPGGTAAYGYILRMPCADPKLTMVHPKHAVLGTSPRMSNNVAEFAGLYAGLAHYATLFPVSGDLIQCYGDSDLVVKVMSGIWKPKADKLYYPYYNLCDGIVKNLRSKGVMVKFAWIPREENEECDALSKVHTKKEISKELLDEAEFLLS